VHTAHMDGQTLHGAFFVYMRKMNGMTLNGVVCVQDLRKRWSYIYIYINFSITIYIVYFI
jgi:hypothetical protein